MQLPVLDAAGGLYAVGLTRLWRAVGRRRGVARWRAACYAAGIVAIATALASPLDQLGEVLFWGHMVQHLVLIVVAAPLLVLGAPLVPLLWVADAPGRRRMGAWWRRWPAARTVRGIAAVLTTPLVGCGLHVGAGLIMWLPAGLAYLAAAGALFVLWLQEPRARSRSPGGGSVAARTTLVPGGANLARTASSGLPAHSGEARAPGPAPDSGEIIPPAPGMRPASLVHDGGLPVKPMIVLRSGPTAAVAVLLAASLCLGASCRSGHPGMGGGGPAAASGDTINKAQHPLDLGGGRRSRGLIEGLFDQTPGADRETPDHTVRQPQPYADMMRHAFGPGRQAYEEPLQQARAPRPPRPVMRQPRHNRQ